jgi:CRP/FNR family transcriptional regulator, cyclic AMP receptor protein
VARVLYLGRGTVDLGATAHAGPDWLGLLIIDGLLAVTLQAGRAHSSWVFGQDDLLRPWDMRDLALTENARWRCLTPTQIALLDGDFNRRAAGAPAVTHTLVERAAETSRWLLARSVIGGAARVEDRLLLLFKLLAERWGKVGRDGIRLSLPITHALLAQMCGVRRPTVTLALRSFRDKGMIYPIGREGWLLSGDPGDWEFGAA